MMQAVQTTLAQGAPWLKFPAMQQIISKPSSPRLGMKYTPRKDKGTVKPLKKDIENTLRQYLSDNPGQSVAKISAALHWERKKVERYMTSIREEVGNGYFLLKDLKK